MRGAAIYSSLVITLCVFMAACEGVTDPAGSVELRTDRETYRMNDEFVLKLTNKYSVGIVLGPSTILCQPMLQRKVNDSWADVGRLAETCHMIHEPSGVFPGATVVKSFGIEPPNFAPGPTYRVTVEFGFASEGNQRASLTHSRPFRIEE